jgi:hypothetical protein
MTDLTHAVLGAYVNAAEPRTMKSIGEQLGKPTRSLIASVVSLCSEALLIRIKGKGAGGAARYEATGKARALWLKMHPASSGLGAA